MKPTHTQRFFAIGLLFSGQFAFADTTTNNELNVPGWDGVEPSYSLQFVNGGTGQVFDEYRTTFWLGGEDIAYVIMSSTLPNTSWLWRSAEVDIMQLDPTPDGQGARLTLSHNYAPRIVITSGDATNPASISINGASVLTQSSADTRYLRTDLTRLQFGTGSLATTNYSLALGERVRANGLGATAIGASHYTTSLQTEHYALGTVRTFQVNPLLPARLRLSIKTSLRRCTARCVSYI